MTMVQITYASLFATFCVGIVVTVRRVVYSTLRRDKRLYALFHVRDDLTELVIQGKLQQDDFVFQHLDSMVNTFIQNIHRLTLKEIFDFIEQRKLDTEEFAQRFVKEVKSKEPETRELLMTITTNLFYTIMEIIVDSSFALRQFIRFAWVFLKILAWLRPIWLALRDLSIIKDKRKAYRVYQSLLDNYIVHLKAAA